MIVNGIETEFNKPKQHFFNLFKATTLLVLASTELSLGDIYWEQVVKFKDEVSSKIEKEITLPIDFSTASATRTVAKVIIFYSDFLEKQQRYQQETLEQREAEKAWIGKQRQELEQVQYWIEAILDYSPFQRT